MPLGNDVVDRDAARCLRKAADSRFQSRILSLREQRLLGASDDPETLIWIFWALKEAAFKTFRQAHRDIPFHPRSFECFLSADLIRSGGPFGIPAEVCWNNDSLPSAVEGGEGWIHARCSLTAKGLIGMTTGLVREEDPVPGTARLSARELAAIRFPQQARVRIHCKEHLARHFGLHPDSIEIIRERTREGKRPPRVFVKGSDLGIDLSLSHDGPWLAWVFSSLPQTA